MRRFSIIYFSPQLAELNLRRFKEAVKKAPNDIEARYDLAKAYLDNGLLQQAKGEFETTLKLNPKHHSAQARLGDIFNYEGNFARAAQWYKRAAQDSNPKQRVEALLSLGTCFELLGKQSSALKAYKQAVQTKPDDYRTHYSLAMFYHRQGKLDSAIAEYKQAKSCQHGEFTWFSLARAYDERGNRAMALSELTAAVARGDWVAKELQEQIRQRGKVQKPWIGIQHYPLPKPWLNSLRIPGYGGLRLLTVFPNSPAEKAGLRIGDVLLKADGHLLTSIEDLHAYLTAKKPGDVALFTIWRCAKTKTMSVRVKLGTML